MRHPKPDAPTIGRGSVRSDEVVTLREFGRRLGLGPRALCDAQRGGLKTCLVGRVKFVVGSHAVEWFERLAERQAGGAARTAEGAGR